MGAVTFHRLPAFYASIGALVACFTGYSAFSCDLCIGGEMGRRHVDGREYATAPGR